LGSPNIPVEAAKLVQEHLHLAFGDFDDHLEDVTIGTFLSPHHELSLIIFHRLVEEQSMPAALSITE